jgi:DNA-binding protein HU-beta
VNKSELVEAVASAAGLDKRQAEAAIGAFVDSVVTKTKAGEQVSIFGFGAFKPTARAARKGRNPQTGAPVKIAASKGVKFQPATAFKTVLNTRATKKAAAKKTTTPAAKKTASKAAPASKAPATKATKAATTKAAVAKSPATKSVAAAKAAATKATTAKATTAKATTAKKAAPAAKTSRATKVTAPAKKAAKKRS